MAMVEAAKELAVSGSHLRFTHQTGERDVAVVRDGYARVGMDAEVELCRSGATTLAELAAAGKPAILIPLPTATDDHQRKNAEAVARAGAAVMLTQAEVTGAVLAQQILSLAADRPARERMGAASRSLARPDAARQIVARALALAGR
jgi:UDP-N-acetylglucosamine--N-acetylmuramyl-(pentapeptide) pyrophosphoryl-undecaprenol N-acetylglucosamine transferase